MRSENSPLFVQVTDHVPRNLIDHGIAVHIPNKWNKSKSVLPTTCINQRFIPGYFNPTASIGEGCYPVSNWSNCGKDQNSLSLSTILEDFDQIWLWEMAMWGTQQDEKCMLKLVAGSLWIYGWSCFQSCICCLSERAAPADCTSSSTMFGSKQEEILDKLETNIVAVSLPRQCHSSLKNNWLSLMQVMMKLGCIFSEKRQSPSFSTMWQGTNCKKGVIVNNSRPTYSQLSDMET